jgi:hypothetical protein
MILSDHHRCSSTELLASSSQTSFSFFFPYPDKFETRSWIIQKYQSERETSFLLFFSLPSFLCSLSLSLWALFAHVPFLRALSLSLFTRARVRTLEVFFTRFSLCGQKFKKM